MSLDGYIADVAGSYFKIAQVWNKEGYKPLEASVWRPARVQRLLENSHYAGIAGAARQSYAELLDITFESVASLDAKEYHR